MERWLKPLLIAGVAISWIAVVVLWDLEGPFNVLSDTAALVAIVVSCIAFVALIRSLTRWNDTRLDALSSQAEAELWSTRGDGGML
jgi:hypothetical protein